MLDNHIKRLALLSAFILSVFIGLAQPKPLQRIFAPGYEWNAGRFDSTLTHPHDTLASAPIGSSAVVSGTLYIKDAAGHWVEVKGSGGTDTASLSSRINRRPIIVTISQLRALGSGSASDSSLFYIRDVNSEGMFRYDASDNTTVDDTATVLISGTKRFKRIFDRVIYPEWWGAKGDNTTNDGPAFNKMFRWIERQDWGTRLIPEVKFLHSNYYTSTSIKFPYTIQHSVQAYPYFKISGDGGVSFRTNQAIDMFWRMPTIQNDFEPMNNNYKLLAEGLYLIGDRSTVGQTGMRIGLQYGGALKNCHFVGFDTAFVGSFLTKFTIEDCFFTVNLSTDIKLQSMAGLFDVSVASSASNDVMIDNTRFFKETGSFAAVALYGTDNTVIRHSIIEGSQPRYGIYSDYQNSTVANTLIIDDIWFEGYSNSPSVNFRIQGSGLTRLSNIQRTYPDTLFDFSGSAAGCQFALDGFTYVGNMAAKPFVTDVDGFSGREIKVTNSARDFSTILFDPTKWKHGVVPVNLFIDYFEGANFGYKLKTTSDIYILPKAQSASDLFRNLYVGANLLFNEDNVGSLGGWYASGDNRPRAIHGGDKGIFTDRLGGYWFGRKGYDLIDVGIVRAAARQLNIQDSAGNFGDLYMRAARANDKSGYLNSYTLAELGDRDFVAKEQLNEAIAANSATIFKDENLLPGANSLGDEITIDTSANKIATKTDVALSVAKDSIYRIPGIDSIYQNRNGVRIAAIKDSTGPGGGGADNWGTDVAHTDNTLTGNGTVASPLKGDTTKLASKYYVDHLPGLSPPNGSETKVIDDIGIIVTGTGTTADPYKIKNTGSPGTNPMNIYDARLNGLVADVTTPAFVNFPVGTNSTPMLNAAIAAAGDGQWIAVAGGPYLFSTPLDTIKGSKRVNIIFLNTIYTAGNDLFLFKNQSGPQEQHNVVFMGDVIGRINMPSQTKAFHDAGTAPVWSTFTGTAVKLFNIYQVNVQFNRIIGFKNGIEFISGGNCVGCNNGCQENTIAGRELNKNANGIVMTSLDGVSYCDKNTIGGINGGRLTVNGGLGLKIDGYSGAAATNGEIYNGAFRSNDFHLLMEGVDSAVRANGDVTYNTFDIVFEGGPEGILGNTGYQMRSIAPNYVLGAKYLSNGVYGSSKLQEGLGINGELKVQVWNGGTYYGNDAIIDDEGNLVFQNSGSISQATRSGAPSNFRFTNAGAAEVNVSITASTYTVAAKVRRIKYNNASGTLTLPSASANPNRQITVFNDNANALTVANASNNTSIPGGDIMTYWSDGSVWRGEINKEGSGAGSSQWDDDPNGITYAGNIGVRTASKAGAAIASPAGTLTIAPVNIPPGILKTTPANGDEENDGDDRYVTLNSHRYKYVLAPEAGGLPGQGLYMNAAGNALEYKYSSFGFGKFHQVTNANVTVADDDFAVIISNMSANRTMTLPDPALYPNRVIMIGQATGNTNTISLSRSVLDGTAVIGSLLNDAKWFIQSDGTNWRIIMTRL